MFELKVRFRSAKAGAFVGSVPALTRAVFAAIGAAFVAGSAISSGAASIRDIPGALGPAGIVVVAIVLLAVFYEERWTFDPASRTVVYRFGLVFASAKRAFPFDSLESVGLERFVKGTRPGQTPPPEDERAGPRLFGNLFKPKAFRSLVLNLADGGRLVVETEAEKKAAALEAAARSISEIAGIPLAD